MALPFDLREIRDIQRRLADADLCVRGSNCAIHIAELCAKGGYSRIGVPESAPGDLDLFCYVDTAEDAWEIILQSEQEQG